MGDQLYLDIWKKFLPVINSLAQKGGGEYQLMSQEFEQCGNRNKYSFRLEIIDGVIPVNRGSAVARDLKTVLDDSPTFKRCAQGKTIVIRLDSSFVLKVYEKV